MNSTEFVNDTVETLLKERGPMLQVEIISELRLGIAECLQEEAESTYIRVLISTALYSTYHGETA